jgi:MFS family permease
VNQSNSRIVITHHRVLWRQVWGLAALLAAIVFSWMAYGFYQPIVMTQLGFAQIASSLGIIQGLLGAAIEPWVGAMSDRLLHRMGSRLPAISAGIALAGLLFVAIGLLLQGNIPTTLRWLVPILMTFWVIAMIIFRGPSISLLRQFAPTEALPAANAILSVVFGLVGALNPIFGRVIDFLGAGNTFLLGAVTLMFGAILMWSTHPQATINFPPPEPPIIQPLTSDSVAMKLRYRGQNRSSTTTQIQIFGVGLIAGVAINILLRISSQRLHETLTTISPEYITAGILFISAIAIFPLQSRVKVWTLDRSMVVSLMSIGATICATAMFAHPVFSVITIGIAGGSMGLLSIAQIPWCLGMLPPQQAGLATGLYFGGISAATAILSLIIAIV